MRLNKRTAIAITVGVWIAGFGALGALAYQVRQPHIRPITTIATIPAVDLTPIVPSVTPAPRTPIIELAPVTIMGVIPRHHDIVKPKHCSAWRPLDIGSGGVQICD